MGAYYFYLMSSSMIQQHIAYDQPRITIRLVNSPLQVDDKIVPVMAPDNIVLPFVYTVVAVNRNAGTATLALEEVYNRTTPLFEATGGHIFVGAGELFKIEAAYFPKLLTRMGGKRMEEKDLLDYIHSYITAEGYYFDSETLYNYHICLKTRPFVILAGLSGTGKSKLTQLYAQALRHTQHYLRLPVRPNWDDDRYLLGHFNAITGEYMLEPAVEFVLEASKDPENLYFFCLDEMNLAHVEYYFSQFLSAMEEKRPEDRKLHLLSKHLQKQCEEQGKELPVPADLCIPTNLFFTGTINVDETTQSISDKVIDRANTLEFFRVDLEKILVSADPLESIDLSTFTWQSYQVTTPDTRYRPLIIEINKILNEASLGLGYRVVHEIELYLANSKDLLDPLVAFDLQVKQRVLPRVRGAEGIKDMLDKLYNFTKNHKLPHSEQRLAEMKERLKRDGYTSFWR